MASSKFGHYVTFGPKTEMTPVLGGDITTFIGAASLVHATIGSAEIYPCRNVRPAYV